MGLLLVGSPYRYRSARTTPTLVGLAGARGPFLGGLPRNTVRSTRRSPEMLYREEPTDTSQPDLFTLQRGPYTLQASHGVM